MLPDAVDHLKRWQKWTLTGLVLLMIYSLIGFIIIPLTARHLVVSRLSEALNRPVSLETVRLNPFTLTLSVENFAVKQKNTTDHLATFKTFFLNFQWSSLFRLAPVVSQVRVDGPAIHLSRNAQGVFNFSDLIPSAPESQAPAPDKTETKSAPLRFSLANIEITGGEIVFRDDALARTHRVENLNLGVPLVSTIGRAAETYVIPGFSADINGKPISLDGKTKPFHETLETNFSLSLKDLDLPHYMEYIPLDLPLTVTSGALTLDLAVAFMNTDGKKPELDLSGEMTLRDLAVTDTRGRPLFNLKALAIGLEPSPVLEGEIRLSAVRLEAPEIHLLREADGNLTIYGLQPEAGAATTDVSIPEKPEESNGFPLRVRLENFRLTDAAVGLSDNPNPEAQAETRPAAEKLIRLALLQVDGFAMDTKTREIRLNEIRSAGGVLRIDRLQDGNLNLQDLAGPTPKRTPASTAVSKTDGGEPAPPWTISLEKMGLDNYQILAAGLLSPDRSSATVTLESLALTGINVESSPTIVRIDDIQFTGLDTALHIEAADNSSPEPAAETESRADEAVNRAAETDTEPPGESPAVIDIGRVTLADARFRFSDLSPGSPFRTELTDINLTITDLSSRPDRAAGVSLSAKLDGQAPLNFSGDINPLAEEIYANVSLTFENMTLSSLSPYSGKYLGRRIAKGKLFTELDYTVKEQSLTGKNHIFIDQLELGKKVAGPDATNLPVQLAVSLLRDREGEIVLDVPVSGDLSDPAFSLSGTILQVFTNLVVKAATSPFSLVSGLLGGTDPSHLEFEYGSTRVDEKLAGVINRLADVLYNRPALAVELAGFVDREKDSLALAEQKLMQKLKKIKHAGLPPKAAQTTAVADVSIAPEEYADYLRQAYAQAAAAGEGKKAAPDQKQKPTVAEIENRMRQLMRVDEQDLKMLADQRARQVRDSLLATGKVKPDRVFVVEAPFQKPESMADVLDSRVDVRLK